KLYAAAMFPGFFLALLYLVYIVGWAMLNPKIAPQLPPEQTRVPVPDWIRKFGEIYSRNALVGFGKALFSPARAQQIETGDGRVRFWLWIQNFAASLVPFILVAGRFWLAWWYVVIHQQAAAEVPVEGFQQLGSAVTAPTEPVSKGPPTAFYVWFGI